ncbi:hypothetical protein OPQ81_002003 [Rhizoctonia solani]|nr:hypothetical protein OPQ81_002003 [Rhizoctonia solani]
MARRVVLRRASHHRAAHKVYDLCLLRDRDDDCSIVSMERTTDPSREHFACHAAVSDSLRNGSGHTALLPSVKPPRHYSSLLVSSAHGMLADRRVLALYIAESHTRVQPIPRRVCIAASSQCMYSFCVSFQCIAPFFAHVPRYIYSIIATAISIPLAMVGAHTYYTSLISFTGVIGYWAAAWASIVLTEHLVFRRSYAAYDTASWDTPSALPTGIAALAAFATSFALIVPSMNQVWFQGPIGKAAGDVGFEVAFALAAVLYVVFRSIEKKVCTSRTA